MPGEGEAQKFEPEIELLPRDEEAEAKTWVEAEAKRMEGVAEIIKIDIDGLLMKDDLSTEEKGMLERLQKAHADLLTGAKEIRERK